MTDSAESNRLALTRPDLLRTRAFIAGCWRDGEAHIPVRNPATNREIASVPDLGEAETLETVGAAERAQIEWRKHSAKERASILRRWFELVIAHREDLARLMTAEQGKPLAEARAEIGYAGAFIEWFAEEAKRA